MDLESEVRKNTTDINALTVNVTRIATLVENSEKRHDSDLEMMKEAVSGISRLNDRIGATVGMERDIAGIKDVLGEKTGDIRTIRHDLNNVLNAMNGITQLNDKIGDNAKATATLAAKVESLEAWRNKADGAGWAAAGLGKVMWSFFGAAVMALGYFVIRSFFREPR
jgi:hypothetical protein